MASSNGGLHSTDAPSSLATAGNTAGRVHRRSRHVGTTAPNGDNAFIGGQSAEGDGEEDKDRYQVQIDRVHYTVKQDAKTGAELRALVTSPVSPDRDMFEVVPGTTQELFT